MIGFTEKVGEKYIEYVYVQSPKEFKEALFEQLQLILENRNFGNMKICRKGDLADKFYQLLPKQGL
ncbi:MAG: hypothetical protein AAF518_00045 [Spirochaetota bacterium]